jgi:ABC-type multidrug transport system fused ATPase/permease subunit
LLAIARVIQVTEQRLKLSGLAKFNYFTPVIFVASLPLIGLAVQIFSPGKNDLTLLILIPIPLAAFLYWYLNRTLRYQLIRTTHSAEENFHAVVSLAHRENWKIKVKRTGFIRAKVGGFPKTMSWGEQVSVQFDGNDVYVNSICDPDERPSISSYGQNAENVESVVRAVSESILTPKTSDQELEMMEAVRQKSIAEDEKTEVWWGRIAITVGVILVVMLIYVPSQSGASLGGRFFLWGSALTALSWGWSRSRSKTTKEDS